MLNSISQDFLIELETQVDERIKKNPSYNSNIVSFMFYFASLEEEWNQFKGCWNEILPNYSVSDRKFYIMRLIQSINSRLSQIARSLIDGGISVELRNREEEFVIGGGLDRISKFNVIFCQSQLADMSRFLEKIDKVLSENITNVQGNDIFKALEKVHLFVQNCLKNLQGIYDVIDNWQLTFIPDLSHPDSTVLEDFSAKLELQINDCIEEHKQYKPDFVRFTCNFSLLVNYLAQFQNYCKKIDYEKCQVKDLLESIDKNVANARKYSQDSYMFIKLNDNKEIVVDFDSSIHVSCKENLIIINDLIKQVYSVVGKDIDGVLKNNFLKTYERICLLVQNCLNSIENVEKELFDSVVSSTSNSGTASLRPLKVDSELEDFVVGLECKINECIKQNSSIKPEFVMFTCNFSALMDYWSKFKDGWEEINNGSEQGLNRIRYVEYCIKGNIEECIYSVKQLAGYDRILVKLKDQKDIELGECPSINKGPGTDIAYMLGKVRGLMTMAYNMIDEDIDDTSKKNSTLKIIEKMKLLAQNCLSNIDYIVKWETSLLKRSKSPVSYLENIEPAEKVEIPSAAVDHSVQLG